MIEIISSLLFPSRIQGRGTTFFEEANLASVTFFFLFFSFCLYFGPLGLLAMMRQTHGHF